jgi:hypothetical protein
MKALLRAASLREDEAATRAAREVALAELYEKMATEASKFAKSCLTTFGAAVLCSFMMSTPWWPIKVKASQERLKKLLSKSMT